MSPREGRAGDPEITSGPSDGRELRRRGEQIEVLATRYHRPKATKRGGKGTRESESPVVPKKPANESPEELAEGRGGRADET